MQEAQGLQLVGGECKRGRRWLERGAALEFTPLRARHGLVEMETEYRPPGWLTRTSRRALGPPAGAW
jgi:hypothetical protein